MLSPLFPAGIITVLSPVFGIVARFVPSAFRGLAILALCLLVTGFVIAKTDLAVEDLAPQAVILFGIVTAGYTLAKPIEGASTGVAIGVVGAICLFGVASAAIAQTSGSAVVRSDAGVFVQILYGAVNGLLGRLFKRWGIRL